MLFQCFSSILYERVRTIPLHNASEVWISSLLLRGQCQSSNTSVYLHLCKKNSTAFFLHLANFFLTRIERRLNCAIKFFNENMPIRYIQIVRLRNWTYDLLFLSMAGFTKPKNKQWFRNCYYLKKLNYYPLSFINWTSEFR